MILDDLEADLRHLAEQIFKKRCVLFVGSGLSTAAGLSSWSEITADLASRMGCTNRHDPLTVAQAYEQRFKRPALWDCLAAHTNTSGKQPTPAHHLLVQLGIRTWITTNFDDLLERVLADASDPIFHPIVTDDGFLQQDPGDDRQVLVKLHGDLQHCKALVFTKNDYFLVSDNRPLIWSWLRVKLATKTFLFVGYSNSDPDFCQLQVQLNSLLQPYGYARSYAIMYGTDDVDRLDLESRNITVIDLGRPP